jgi:hypothetical protein
MLTSTENCGVPALLRDGLSKNRKAFAYHPQSASENGGRDVTGLGQEIDQRRALRPRTHRGRETPEHVSDDEQDRRDVAHPPSLGCAECDEGVASEFCHQCRRCTSVSVVAPLTLPTEDR